MGMKLPRDRISKVFQMSRVKRTDVRLFITSEDLQARR